MLFDKESLSQLFELQEKLKKPLVENLISTYKETTPPTIERLAELYQSEKIVELGEIAHSLKSSSANLGFLDFSKLLQEIESHIRDEHPVQKDYLKNRVSQLNEVYVRSLDSLDTYLKTQDRACTHLRRPL